MGTGIVRVFIAIDAAPAAPATSSNGATLPVADAAASSMIPTPVLGMAMTVGTVAERPPPPTPSGAAASSCRRLPPAPSRRPPAPMPSSWAAGSELVEPASPPCRPPAPRPSSCAATGAAHRALATTIAPAPISLSELARISRRPLRRSSAASLPESRLPSPIMSKLPVSSCAATRAIAPTDVQRGSRHFSGFAPHIDENEATDSVSPVATKR